MVRDTPVEVQAGERQVARSIVVDAPVDVLFALIANPHRHYEFDGSGTVRSEVQGPERISAGDTFRVRMKMFGIPYTMTNTATRVEEGRVVEWGHFGKHRWRYEFEPVGVGQTRVTETFDYRDSPMARVFEVLGIPKRNGSGIEQTLEKLDRMFG